MPRNVTFDRGVQIAKRLGYQIDSCVKDTAYREKYWEELTLLEKVERLGRVMEDNARTWARTSERIDEVSQRVPEHIHRDGKLYFPENKNIGVNLLRDPDPLNRRPSQPCAPTDFPDVKPKRIKRRK